MVFWFFIYLTLYLLSFRYYRTQIAAVGYRKKRSLMYWDSVLARLTCSLYLRGTFTATVNIVILCILEQGKLVCYCFTSIQSYRIPPVEFLDSFGF